MTSPIQVKIIFTHNAKNEGTLASRGATYQVRGYDLLGEFDVCDFRWTDGLADYKVMTVVVTRGIAVVGDVGFRIYWKVDNASYPAWSKERNFIVEATNITGAPTA